MTAARLTFEEAVATVARVTRPLAREIVAIERALGRVMAAPAIVQCDSPPFAMSAMDGFAITQGDRDSGRLDFGVGEELVAGNDHHVLAHAGIAFPISTGARLPDGCGAVIPRERATLSGTRVTLHGPPQGNANIRQAREEARRGEMVGIAGTWVSAGVVGALASFGVRTVDVYRRPQAALIVTGDEVGRQIRDANGPMIAAGLEQCRTPLIYRGEACDEKAVLYGQIRRAIARDADLILSTGGVSVGARDHLGAVLADLGASIHFHGVAMRPGKPVLFATLPDGRPFFGLPGNPVAALAGFRFFVVTALRRMQGLPREEGLLLPNYHPGKPDLTILLKARHRSDALPLILPGQESHKLRPLLDADRWIAVSTHGDRIETRAFPIDPC